MIFASLAQLVRAPALQAGGRRFESYNSHHSNYEQGYKKVFGFPQTEGWNGQTF